jgi:amino acid transporter
LGGGGPMADEAAAAEGAERAGAKTGGALRRGSIGVAHIVFFVIATAGPLVSLVGAAPAAIAFGNGLGLPGVYVVVALLYLLFSVGYTAMSRHVTNAGAFFAYIATGLGPAWGLAGAFVAVLAYSAVQLATYALFGVFCRQGLVSLIGQAPPWWAFALGAAAAVQVLGRRTIVFSGRLLGVLLVAEILIVLLLDGAIFVSGAHPPLASFDPAQVFTARFGAALAFVAPCFLGFEATAIFGEEARDPARTIPRATYAAVSIIGAVYAVSSWAILGAYPRASVVAQAGQHASTFFFDVADRLMGPAASGAMSVLMTTSMFAALLSLHNAIARYFYALARAGLLPDPLARTHRVHASPHVAGAVQSAIMVAAIGVVIALRADPYGAVFAWSAAVAALSILAVQCAASLAVFAFFRADRRGVGPVAAVAAPLAAAAALAGCCALLIANLPLIAGARDPAVWGLPAVTLLTGLAGVAAGRRLRRRDPVRYRAIGSLSVS